MHRRVDEREFSQPFVGFEPASYSLELTARYRLQQPSWMT